MGYGPVEAERERIAQLLLARAARHKEASRHKDGCHWERGDELEHMARQIRDGAHEAHNEERES